MPVGAPLDGLWQTTEYYLNLSSGIAVYLSTIDIDEVRCHIPFAISYGLHGPQSAGPATAPVPPCTGRKRGLGHHAPPDRPGQPHNPLTASGLDRRAFLPGWRADVTSEDLPVLSDGQTWPAPIEP
jgi:hypothetical protein